MRGVRRWGLGGGSRLWGCNNGVVAGTFFGEMARVCWWLFGGDESAVGGLVYGLGLVDGSEVVFVYLFLLYIKVYRCDCAAAYSCY